MQLTEEERRKKFRWARGSKEAKEVKHMEQEFRKKVDAVSEMALEAKRKKKQNIHKKMLTNLTDFKKHGGPLTEFDIERIDDLNHDQVPLEAGYRKKTIAPNKKRVKEDDQFHYR